MGIQIIIKTVIVYFFILLIMKFMGKREIGQLSLFDFVILLLIADASVMGIDNSDIPLYYFLLAIFQERTCFAYKVIDALLSSTAFNLIHDAYYKIVTKGQISAIKPNRKIPFDKEFHSLIEESIEEMKLLNDERLSSIHILLSLINPDKEHFNVQKIMKGAGLNYNLLINKSSYFSTNAVINSISIVFPVSVGLPDRGA